ncbi:KAP family P-loop NTPase fold protein [Viridibacillus sp. NPDC093762]|uniref:KAP family P-loop NTPase fold protein n=1 Tax=Viridibacillus sp. NPDC093762 TaxID=3390720 RepID=UPI003D0403E4
MWADDASKIDMLAYRPYADLITEIAINDRMNPLTIGLFGNWGSGKSTLLHLIEEQVTNYDDKKIAVVKVNAWMFEGYEDAKTAIIQAILQGMEDNTTFFEEKKGKIKELLSRVNWLNVGKSALKNGVPLAISGFTGIPPIFMLPDKSNFDTTEELQTILDKPKQLMQDYLKESSDNNIVENVRSFRNDFSSLIKESSVDNLVILIDDLDRCNPDRIIETLEAIKLFLSVDKTTFVIAMDENIISYSIKRKYPQLDSNGIDVSVDYIEKIVQLPIRIAELAESDVKNYMLLLITEMYLKDEVINQLITKLKDKGIFIKGEILTGAEIIEIVNNDIQGVSDKFKIETGQSEFEQQIQIFNVIGNIVASSLKGNPRQTKRFLNTFYIRKRLAEIQGLELNLSILAKLMVLEYFDSDLFKELFQWQFEHSGVPEQIKELESKILDEQSEATSTEQNINSLWSSDKLRRWIGTEPRLSGVDLSTYFYLARDTISDRRIFSKNLNQDERKFINQICNLESNKAIRRKKIEQLLNMDEVTRSEILKGVIEKFHQDKNQLETLIDIYLKIPQYKTKLFNEFKNLSKDSLEISEVLLFQQLNAEEYAELKTYYVDIKGVENRIWEI